MSFNTFSPVLPTSGVHVSFRGVAAQSRRRCSAGGVATRLITRFIEIDSIISFCWRSQFHPVALRGHRCCPQMDCCSVGSSVLLSHFRLCRLTIDLYSLLTVVAPWGSEKDPVQKARSGSLGVMVFLWPLYHFSTSLKKTNKQNKRISWQYC